MNSCSSWRSSNSVDGSGKAVLLSARRVREPAPIRVPGGRSPSGARPSSGSHHPLPSNSAPNRRSPTHATGVPFRGGRSSTASCDRDRIHRRTSGGTAVGLRRPAAAGAGGLQLAYAEAAGLDREPAGISSCRARSSSCIGEHQGVNGVRKMWHLLHRQFSAEMPDRAWAGTSCAMTPRGDGRAPPPGRRLPRV